MAVKDWLPALAGGLVGAADPQSGQALVGGLSMADAFKRRRMMDERTAAAQAQANQQFEWAKARQAEWDRDRTDAEHDRVLMEQARGNFDFTDWTADAIAAANAADNPMEFYNVVEAVKGREYRVAAEQRAQAGEQRVSETYNYGVSRRPTEEAHADAAHRRAESASGRAAEQYGYDKSMRPFEQVSRFSPLLSSYILTGSQVPSATRRVGEAETEAAYPPERTDPYTGAKAPHKATEAELKRNPDLAAAEKKHAEKGTAEVAAAQDDVAKLQAQQQAVISQLQLQVEALPPGPARDGMMATIQKLTAGQQPASGGLDPALSAQVDQLVNAHINPGG